MPSPDIAKYPGVGCGGKLLLVKNHLIKRRGGKRRERKEEKLKLYQYSTEELESGICYIVGWLVFS